MPMKNFAQCPDCKGRIGIFPIAKALVPLFFKCPHCRTKIRVKGVLGKVFLLFILCGAAAAHYLTNSKDATFWVPILLVVVAQVGAAFIIFNKGKLTTKTKKEVAAK
jgi:DNA-directed RNA polymerase subunit RPC12/RpoP